MSTNSSDYTLNPFGYTPVFGLAVAATVVYSLFTIIISIQSIYYGIVYFIVMSIVGVAESVGYGLRCALSSNVYLRTPYIIMLCLIILAPVGLAFTNYVLVGRLIRYVGREYSLVNPLIVEWAFIASDIISIVVQGGGAALLTSTDTSKISIGQDILIAGLVINLISFCFFSIITIYLDYSIRKRRQQQKRAETENQNEKWRYIFYALYLSMTLLILRSIYRIVEFVTGFRGYVATSEVLFYIFDTLLMLVAFGLFIPMHPGIWMPKKPTVATLTSST
ncbi:unnamed protein product [Didymodactylos carnosus]|uniref:RTA1 like protein n=1 Tax=Didymodactylos carnosus TaxID=1234261 RepID=A0A815B9L8_9BILA|nr:unnamed protein product [Didymodactylos carnosus]CAF1473282.1 unnamed protein product [Didymodactylos carnosus]CAF4046371.1 unnamed protein product [Didymodactylos carnosus]CAF4264789.1 unnamed protein product [Didymodactylos carnosus]